MKMPNWTQAEIDVLIAMRRDENSCAEIGEFIGRTTEAVASKIRDLKTLIEQPEPLAYSAPAVRRDLTRAERMTASFCGDPDPGRSALDQRAQP